MAALVSTIVLTAIALGLGGFSFVRHRNWRSLVRGIGFGAVFIGLFFLGITDLAVQGVNGVISWVQATTWTQQMTNAAIATGVGVGIALLAGFLPTGDASSAAGSGEKQVRPQPGKASPQITGKPATAVSPKSAPHDPEDDEIEALLRARGIE